MFLVEKGAKGVDGRGEQSSPGVLRRFTNIGNFHMKVSLLLLFLWLFLATHPINQSFDLDIYKIICFPAKVQVGLVWFILHTYVLSAQYMLLTQSSGGGNWIIKFEI